MDGYRHIAFVPPGTIPSETIRGNPGDREKGKIIEQISKISGIKPDRFISLNFEELRFLQRLKIPWSCRCSYCETLIMFVILDYYLEPPEGATDLNIEERRRYIWCPRCNLVTY